MVALMSSAQSWVPWAGLAAFLLCKCWIKAIVDDDRAGRAVAAFFVCLGLGAVVPAVASLIGWMLSGGIAFLGPLGVLPEPAGAAQMAVLVWLGAPAATYLVARYGFRSSESIAFAAAVATSFAFWGKIGAPLVLALSAGAGGLAAAANRLLGDVPTSLAATIVFVLTFALSFAGGGDAFALLTLAVVGGYVLSLIAAGGGRARLPVFLVMPLLPVLGLSYWDAAATGFDLTRELGKPAVGSVAGLLLMFALVPAAIAPFAWLPTLIARSLRKRSGLSGLIVQPAAIVAELASGLLLAAVAAIALSFFGALYGRLHEFGGGAPLLRVETMLRPIQVAPLAPGQWWIVAPLLLPLVVFATHLVAFLTGLWLRLIDASGLGPWLEDAIGDAGVLHALLLSLAKRVFQLVPSAVVIWLGLEIAMRAKPALDIFLAPVANGIFELCRQAAHAIDVWPIH